MAKAKCSEEEFIRLFEEHGAAGLAKAVGIAERNIHSRRRSIEGRIGRVLLSRQEKRERPIVCRDYPARMLYQITNGIGLVGSDCHFWPGIVGPAHRGYVYLAKKLGISFSCLNGDVLDGARISRHGRIGWAQTPTLKEELDACEQRTDEIRAAAPDGCELFWTKGNHDGRFETYLSGKAPDAEGVSGMTLQERFPHWQMSMSLWVNDNVIIKHRMRGGEHAGFNNTIRAGRTVLTGHDHILRVTPYSDYNGLRWGVHTGTMADPYGPQSDYSEDNVRNHCSGFIVLTFVDGMLLQPEIAYVVDQDYICFRGEIIRV